MMKKRVMDTVHALLVQSGQSVPARHLSIGVRSLQIYDVEHWPESFNSLLLHDFPSMVISVDGSIASLSGFVVTLHWKPDIDLSECVAMFVHVFVVSLLIVLTLRACLSNLHEVSLDSLQEIRDMYTAANGTARDFGGRTPSSVLAGDLRSVMAQAEL
jgi:hypothetical protein